MANEVYEITKDGVTYPLQDRAAFPRSEQAVLGAKNVGEYINQALVGDDTTGYSLVSGGSSLIAEIANNKEYIVQRKSGQGDRFRVVLFTNTPSTTPDTSALQVVFDNTKNEYTFNSGNYNYAVFTYVSSSSTPISQDTAEAMISFDGGEYVPFVMTNELLMNKKVDIINITTEISSLDNIPFGIGSARFDSAISPTGGVLTLAYICFGEKSGNKTIIATRMSTQDTYLNSKYEGSWVGWKKVSLTSV